MSPTQRALKQLRDLGFTCGIVEKWNMHTKQRQDLFGCIDLICVRDGVGIVGVQATSGTNHSARREKSIAEPRLREGLEAGGRFEIVSFSKRGERGKRKLWTMRREELVLQDGAIVPRVSSPLPPNTLFESGGGK